MKKTTLIAAALASLLLAACGAVDSSTDGTTTTTAAPAASQEQTPESETASEPGSQPEDEPASQEDSEPDESTGSVPDKTEPNMTEHEWLISNIEDGSFTSTDGETVTFTQLVEQGKANAYKEGCAFALVSAGGGAGHTYYDCYTTTDGGKNWEKGSQPVDLFSGVSYSFAVEDGRLMFLAKRGAFDDPAPVLETSAQDTSANTGSSCQWQTPTTAASCSSASLRSTPRLSLSQNPKKRKKPKKRKNDHRKAALCF